MIEALAAMTLLSAPPEQVARPQPVIVIRAIDDPDRLHVRDEQLAAHIAFVETHFARYAVAGPILDEAGAMIGSLFILHAADEADARAFMADEPYVVHGLYGSLEYHTVRPAAGSWIGGVIWPPAGASD
ncbi:YciI family protein [Glycocaulis sp.]